MLNKLMRIKLISLSFYKSTDRIHTKTGLMVVAQGLEEPPINYTLLILLILSSNTRQFSSPDSVSGEEFQSFPEKQSPRRSLEALVDFHSG